MKKNRAMRLAALLLVAVLMSTCAISGTFAKYVTEVKATDNARVAYWGFEATNSSISFENLFEETYGSTVKSSEVGKNVIAPGTSGYATFKFDYDPAAAAPEVAYTFEVDTDESICDPYIQANKNIIWYLNDVKAPAASGYDEGTWGALMVAIETLSGDVSGSKLYDPGQLPDAFNANQTYKVSWEWLFEGGSAHYNISGYDANQDEYDTWMGNNIPLDNVTLTIRITATQED